jgi:hypothetical protein
LQHPQRNPDGLYQSDALAAIGTWAQIDIPGNQIIFGIIYQAQRFDFAKTAEYDDRFILACDQPAASGWSGPGSGVVTEVHYMNVHCKILGLRK